MIRAIISFFILGLTFGAGPCLASCGPLLIAYVAGTGKDVRKSIWVYFIFSLSRILIYALLGLVVFLFAHALVKYTTSYFTKYLFIFAGALIIVIGLLIALGKNLHYKFCQRLGDFWLKKDTKTVIILGLIIGILPCAPLISVISYIGLTARHWLNSLFYGFAFGLGTMISPLFLLVVSTGLIPRIMVRENSFYRIFNAICGLIIVFLGIQLIRKVF